MTSCSFGFGGIPGSRSSLSFSTHVRGCEWGTRGLVFRLLNQSPAEQEPRPCVSSESPASPPCSSSPRAAGPWVTPSTVRHTALNAGPRRPVRRSRRRPRATSATSTTATRPLAVGDSRGVSDQSDTHLVSPDCFTHPTIERFHHVCQLCRPYCFCPLCRCR